MIKLLEPSNSSSLSSTNTEHNLPSSLLVKIAMKINKLENYSFIDKMYAKAEECKQFEEMLEESICDSCDEIKKNCNKLENLLLLNEYYNSFPLALTSFFDRLIESIKQQKYAVREKTKNSIEKHHQNLIQVL
ncbi:hypothetical protein F8M41_025639 [Gigaspora margarita]|uniref:Uncharacterized protein n=1 Tax=Gigaspora margarita TaxID=4874 RepID=A0A8H4A9P7_GIGMA|nr:hypothetical protein F8M41_025639 [Gigaspora margarita]